MAKVEKSKSLVDKLRHKYRLAVFNEQTFEEVFGMRLSRLNVFITIGITSIVLIVFVIYLIAFTGLREYIPGYPSGHERRLIIQNTQRVDSLIWEIERRDKFFRDIRAIMSGELPEGATAEDIDSLNEYNNSKISFKKSEEDSIFREQIEREEKFNLSAFETTSNKLELEHRFLFTPLKGVVVNKFGESEGHYGVDIVAKEGARVSSVLEGTVIFTGWTVETGYVIQVQHSHNLISLYKHNERLLKSMGDKVQAGEAIAHVGNSGEFTTGPHLHFELWYNGVAIDAEQYMSFE
ncbi:M23 family metallopeptidase [Carboxylicivirga linearis]|uniref:M23 family metallopeptidase n=1 Tax=Carboxylicivirga linearis TaxID=1628157 RepID=A0ABS5JTK5_9BACT|nr:M23 family metallopeptidase [Carboxylicivirga linearis]MBS2097771.1 M23 family metallopeptidase [Carboxylicivirga linearis]